MKIPNPFYREKNVRYTCKPSGVVGVVGVTESLDVPDDSVEVLIEAVNKGKSNADVVFGARVWSAKWGVQDVESHLNRMTIEKEQADLAATKAKMAKRYKVSEPVKEAPPAAESPLGPPLDLGTDLKL